MTSVPLDPLIFGEDQTCFGCSPTHPTGLRMGFTREGDVIVTELVPGEGHQGPPGIMHGGLVTTLADELAAWVIIGVLGKFGFTAAIECKILKPLRVGIPVQGRAWIIRPGTRVVRVAVVLSQKGEEAYKGEFTFALVDRSGAEKLLEGPLPAAWEKFCR
ncbi:MAG: thioesterase superfamily protein [Myxococcaceae bacterium]|nr:thioesterase superfamily protein [Myxococcaceae bacterium]